MRQAALLNFVVIVLLLLLFAAMYRRRRTEQLRFWLLGWCGVLANFSVLISFPRIPSMQLGASALSGAALLFGSFSFLAALPASEPFRRRAAVLAGLTLPVLALTVLYFLHMQRPAYLVPCDLLLQGFLLVLLWRTELCSWPVALTGTLLVLGSTQWSLLALVAGHEFSALSALCMELFALNGILYAFCGGRRTTGLGVVVVGMLTWSAAFLVAVFAPVWWPRLTVNPEFWAAPGLAVVLGMLLMLFENELALTEREREQYRSLFHANPLPMWIFEADSTRLLEVNDAAVRTFGWGSGDLDHLMIENLLAEDQDGPVGLTEMNWSLAGTAGQAYSSLSEPLGARCMLFETKDGMAVPVEVSLQRVQFRGKEARLLIAKDITAEVRARDQLVHLANHDPLTGLPNRLLLHDRMEFALAKAARNGTGVAVVCVDLDRFKQINDAYGHAAGDSCLREVAARFRQRLRSVDTVARTGGEEFTIILDEVGRQEDAESVINDLLFALGPPHVVDGRPIQLSASMGVALAPEHGANASELMVRADKAMYSAKQNGGNSHTVFTHAG